MFLVSNITKVAVRFQAFYDTTENTEARRFYLEKNQDLWKISPNKNDYQNMEQGGTHWLISQI